MSPPLKVVYILGAGHSGSTLLGMMLGAHSRIHGGGELKYFNSLIHDKETLSKPENYCSCGQPIPDCLFWKKVTDGLPTNSDTDPAPLFQSLLQAADKDALCDFSKNADRLESLLQNDSMDITILHLVRDPRAYVHSQRRTAQRKKEILSKEKLEKYSMRQAINRWRINRKLHQTFQSATHYLQIRYEDLALKPEAELTRIMSFLQLSFEPEQLQYGSGNHHTFLGNRMRLQKDAAIRLDDEFIHRLPAWQWQWISWQLRQDLKLFQYPHKRQGLLQWIAKGNKTP